MIKLNENYVLASEKKEKKISKSRDRRHFQFFHILKLRSKKNKTTPHHLFFYCARTSQASYVVEKYSMYI